jgi:hypothetical protein
MIKSPLSEDLGSSPCLALIAARVPMARCWSHAIGDLCLSVQVTLNRPARNFRGLACAEVGGPFRSVLVTLNRPDTKFPSTCMRGGGVGRSVLCRSR